MQPAGKAAAAPTLVGVRAGLLGGAVTAFAAIAHLSAGGLLPPWPLALLIATGAMIGIAPLAQQEMSTRRVLLVMCGGQLVLHAAFTLVAGHQHADSIPAELAMTGAHLVAAASLALLLARGERGLWSLLALLSALAAPVRRAVRLLALVPSPAGSAGPLTVAPVAGCGAGPRDLVRAVAPRRGPPARS